MLSFQDDIENPFTHQYFSSEMLPDTARKRIPPGLQNLIEQDNASLFSFFENTLPLSYQSLCELPPLSVLEWVIERESWDGQVVQDHHFFWGMDLGFKLLTFDIPQFELNNPLREKYQHPEVDALPAALASLYRQFDGMGLCGGFGLKSFDFPWCFDHWQPLSEYYEDIGLSSGDAFLPFRDRAKADPHVISRLRNNDFLVVDKSSAAGELFLINYQKPDEAHVVAIKQLDSYYSQALMSGDASLYL